MILLRALFDLAACAFVLLALPGAGQAFATSAHNLAQLARGEGRAGPGLTGRRALDLQVRGRAGGCLSV